MLLSELMAKPDQKNLPSNYLLMFTIAYSVYHFFLIGDLD